MRNEDLIKRDLASLWHPCSQMKDHEWLPLIPIRRGEGAYLEDFNGKRYLDAISSWWVNLFGHANPYINIKLREQLDKLEQVLLAGFSHEPAINLAERLLALSPPGLGKVFYSDNGSTAVEVALKMSFHYWRNQGYGTKNRFIALTNSYHGETLGALGVGDLDLYKQTYAPLMHQAIHVQSPDCYLREQNNSWHDHSVNAFAAMEHALEHNAHDVAAVIVEPLVQCAGSMRMYHPVYLQILRKACDRYNVHLIADEVAVGFGRTGTLFACEQADITPDFLCLGKGLTGGYLPLSATITTNNIYDAFYADFDKGKAFLHSHSYTGNPLACVAALASLDLFQQHNTLERNLKLAQHLAAAIAHYHEHPHVADIRQTGMIAAIEMVRNKEHKQAYDPRERRGLRVYQHALSKGVLLRPLGDVIYFMPPYVVDENAIDTMVSVAGAGLEIATQN